MLYGSKNTQQLIEVNIIHQQLGGTKEPAKEEQVTIDFAFSTVVSIKKIFKGEKFSKENIWVKRPRTGEILLHPITLSWEKHQRY